VRAIAVDAFPVNSIVCASLASGSVAADTAGEVIGHTLSGEVKVRFKEGELAFDSASLHAVDLPDGWKVNQESFFLIKVPGEVSIGQAGKVLGWSKPFDCNKIMAECKRRKVNVLLSKVVKSEDEQQRHLVS